MFANEFSDHCSAVGRGRVRPVTAVAAIAAIATHAGHSARDLTERWFLTGAVHLAEALWELAVQQMA